MSGGDKAFKETSRAKKGAIEWVRFLKNFNKSNYFKKASFWEGNEEDFVLKKKLHVEDEMVRIDISKETKKEFPAGLPTLFTLEWLYCYKTPLSVLKPDLCRLQNLKVIETEFNNLFL